MKSKCGIPSNFKLVSYGNRLPGVLIKQITLELT